MKAMGDDRLLSIPQAARRLAISDDAAFDLAFVSRDLPLEFTEDDHGVPEHAVEAYRRARAASHP